MKFLNLFKKELRELVNSQMIAGLILTVVLFMAIGNIMSGIMEEAASETGEVSICDLDGTEYTQSLISTLKETGFEVNMVDEINEDRAKLLKTIDKDSLIIIPEGFTKQINDGNTQASLELVSALTTTSSLATLGDASSAAVDIIESCTKNYILNRNGLTDEKIAIADAPLAVSEVTVVSEKSAEISPDTLIGLISSQGMIIPIVVFILVMFTSQMIITSISTEKIDKTLETLLSAPVSRLSVLSAKMLAAGIVALVNAAVYMVGFYSYMGSMMSGAMDVEATAGSSLTVDDIMKELGLRLSIGDYVLVGLQMFITIMICLALAMILGALVNDAKSAQTMLTPIMVLAMIPYLVSMIYDVNLLSPALKTLIYAIPFTHTFNAMNNIMFGKMDIYWFGLLYQLVLFAVCMFFAVKLFTSDKIFTISLNFGQKMKLKKSKK